MSGGVDWFDILIGWLPVLLLIAVWVMMLRRNRDVYTGKSGKTHGEMLEEHLSEMRRQNDLLEKVVKDQEARIQKLENRRQSSGTGSTGGAGGGGR